MQTIRNLTRRVPFQVTVLVLVVMTCLTSSRGWCGDRLWIANDDGYGIESFTSKQLKKTGSPTPLQLLTYPDALGLAFDKSHNLWAVESSNTVVEFTAGQLKNLKNDQSPTPAVTITSTSTFEDIVGCNFDRQGNLWVVDYSRGSIDELSKAQLAVGSKNLTPAVVVSFSDPEGPNFVTFDKAGNAWVDGESDGTVGEFPASALASGGTQSPVVMLLDDGSGTSLSDPGEIAFDKKGNLWVPNYASSTVVEYAKNQLRGISDPQPEVKLTAVFDGPWGAAFDGSDNLWVFNYTDGKVQKFTPRQLKASGAPVPKVSVTDGFFSFQIVFGPSS